MRICLILEGSYPYVHGGVSTWMHAYIQAMQEHEFVLWVIGAKAEQKGKFVYDLPDNVTEIHEVFLDDALKLFHEISSEYIVFNLLSEKSDNRDDKYYYYSIKDVETAVKKI